MPPASQIQGTVPGIYKKLGNSVKTGNCVFPERAARVPPESRRACCCCCCYVPRAPPPLSDSPLRSGLEVETSCALIHESKPRRGPAQIKNPGFLFRTAVILETGTLGNEHALAPSMPAGTGPLRRPRFRESPRKTVVQNTGMTTAQEYRGTPDTGMTTAQEYRGTPDVYGARGAAPRHRGGSPAGHRRSVDGERDVLRRLR